MVIGNLSFNGADESIVCHNLSIKNDNTENSSILNLAMIDLQYMNSAEERVTNLLNLTFDVSVVPENVNFENTHVVFVAIGNVTSEYTINMKLPEIFNNRNKTLLGQFPRLLDGDNNTCVDLPVKGNFPPIFLTRVHTSWLGVYASPFEISLIGKGISCQRISDKVSKVSVPTSNSTNGFHGDLKFCDVMYNSDMNRNSSKCVYNCQCKSHVECSEVSIFMANRADASPWTLCEINAIPV